MLMLLIALVVAAVLAAVLLLYMGEGYGTRHFIAGVAGLVLAVATGIVAIGYSVVGWDWIAADSKAQIINREYHTNYTREEVFYASDVIDTIREIDRKRVEVNGDLMRDKADK